MDVSRRGFIGALTIAGASTPRLLSTAPLSPRQAPHSLDDPDLGWPGPANPRTGGNGAYRYHWTGLKGSVDNAFRVGQWLAWPTVGHRNDLSHPPYLYLNVPGMVGGAYSPGMVFNISSRDRFIQPATSIDDITAWIAEGERYLHQLMSHFANRRAERIHNFYMQFPTDVVKLWDTAQAYEESR